MKSGWHVPWIGDVFMRSTPAFLFLLAACSGNDAPPPNDVRAQIAEDLVAVVDAAEASTADGQSLPDTTQFSLLESAIGGSFEGLLPVSTSTTISSLRARFAPEDETEEDPFDGEEAAQWLNDNIFTDA